MGTDKLALVRVQGYVRLHTNLGDLNIELHCDQVPLMCENFLLLAERGFFDNTTFHRLIPGFMVRFAFLPCLLWVHGRSAFGSPAFFGSRRYQIQGGDPTASGTGGKSAWGKPLKDEIVHTLRHSGRGILSMANAGPGTNTSQLYGAQTPASLTAARCS